MMLSSEFCKLTLAIWMFVAVARLKSAAACTSLITNNGNVKFSASTSAVGPGFPHVNSNDVWCASVINDEQYLQVDLGFSLYMDYVIVQGMSNSNRSVSQYYLMTSTDNDNYEEILISGRNRRKAFYGPFFDGDIGASENLSTPIEARYVRFNPQEPMIQNENHLCMRVDILSCGNVPSPIDGGLSEWSAWSPCPGGCTYITSRTRTCTEPAPAFGGAQCDAYKAEDQRCPGDCNARVDGSWSSWSAWSACSEPCGVGVTSRERFCNNPSPSPDGSDCPGSGMQTRECFQQNCTSNDTMEMSTASPTRQATITGSQGDQTGIPNIDLLFAISVGSNESNQTYSLVKSTIKEFIDKYGVGNVRYSIILYSHSVLRVVTFNRTFQPSAEELKASLDAETPSGGVPDLALALQETSRIFNETMDRPTANKALVIITDKNSANDKDTLVTAVRPLEDEGILVISVAVGSVNGSELLVISPNPLDVIQAHNNTNPSTLAENIMDRILRIIPEIDVGFAITATSISSKVIFNLKLETIDAINKRYKGYNVNFSIIVYGSVRETRLSLADARVNHQQLIADVSQLASSSLDLTTALVRAENLFRSLGRPGAKKIFVPLTDTGNDNEVIAAGDVLRRHGIILLSIKRTGNIMNSVTITHIDYLGTPSVVTGRPVVIAETIIYKALQVNIPLIDLTFAVSTTSVQADRTNYLIKRTINSIVLQYGVSRIHYSVIFFGSVATTYFDFSNAPPDQHDLVRAVSHLPKGEGSPDLSEALKEARRVYELRQVRPNARRFLVVIMDNASVSNENDLKSAVNDLVNNSIFIIGVGIGTGINPTDLNIITREVQHTLIVGVNKSPGELAGDIMDIIELGIRTAGFSNWGWWTACSRTCRSNGISGTQTRRRVCINPALGCEGVIVQTRECNTENCQGCEERAVDSYQASSGIDTAALARLNSSNPGLSEKAWCPDPFDSNAFVQVDLGELVLTTQVATKGEELSNAFVKSFFVTLSADALDFFDFEVDGVRQVFVGNTDPTNVVFNDLNSSSPVRYVRFHPITFQLLPCMQVSVFGCTADASPAANELSSVSNIGTGVLIALWVLAGVLSLLLLLACVYYCCCHVCCARGKKRRGLTYLIEEELGDNRWVLMPSGVGAPSNRVQSEIQEVTVDMTAETDKPSGVIHFGVEANETKENAVTKEVVHSETPVYSDEVLAINSNSNTMSSRSNDSENGSSYSNQMSMTSGTTNSRRSSNGSESRRKAGHSNAGLMGTFDWLTKKGKSSIRAHGKNMTKFENADELESVDYDMFEKPSSTTQARGTDQSKTMHQSAQELENTIATVEAGRERHGSFVNPLGSEQIYVEEQEFTRERNMYILEEWMKTAESEGNPAQANSVDEAIYSEVGAQLNRDYDPTYLEVGSQLHMEDDPTYSVVGSQL